jgi:hypothetical protein
MPDMGDISGSVEASAGGSGFGGGNSGSDGGANSSGSANVDPSAGLTAPTMSFTAQDALTMAAWLSGAAAIVAKASLPTSLLLGGISMGLFSETQSGLFSQALPHLATDIARSMGWGLVQTPNAILMSGPDGYGAAVGPTSISVMDFNPASAPRDSGGSESNT